MDYTRQEYYLGKTTSKYLQKKTALIIGVGALGSVAAELLARMGINLILIDRDLVEKSNLQRQTLYTAKDIGKNKATTAQQRLTIINPSITITAHNEDYTKDAVHLGKKADIILDCTDNLFTRFIINDYCAKNKKPWVFASAIETQGSIYPVLPKQPCFQCIFNQRQGIGTCNTLGVLNTITTLIASIQVQTSIDILLGKIKEPRFTYINLANTTYKTFHVQHNKQCRTCNHHYDYLTKSLPVVSFCGTNRYQFRGTYTKKQLHETHHHPAIIQATPHRIIITAPDEQQAIKIYAETIGY
ncbi:MAG: HesA/MoeB/ThiF family protein [Nanoarchaeota archaeon]|nr:HesA/MoeB/ThiF family protein [Nanoarchaeota archaeon]